MANYNRLNLSFVVLVANIGTLLFGYEVGATSFTIFCIENYADRDDDSINLLGLVASTASLGAAVTYPFLLVYGNSLNKRTEIIIAASFFFIGSLLVSIAGGLDWEEYTGLCLLLIGRFLYGCGIATTLHSVPQYISEVVPPGVRGCFGASSEAMVMTGMCLGFAVGYTFEVMDSGWVATFGVSCGLAILMASTAYFLPDSPTWMVHNNCPHQDILAAIQFVYPDADEKAVDDLIKKSKKENDLRLRRQEERKSKVVDNIEDSCLYRCGIYNLMTPEVQLMMEDRTLYRGLLIKVIINALKIFTGQTAILYYASAIFGELYPTHVEELIMGYIALRTLVAYMMVFLADIAGRRDFMVASAANMGLALLVVTLAFAYSWDLVAVIALFAAGVGFEYGFGSMTYFLLNEVVPFYIRSPANAIANCFLFTCYFAMTFIFPTMETYLGFALIFMIFTLFNVYALYFIYFYLPETKGVDLEEAFLLVDPMFDSAPEVPCCGPNDMSGGRGGTEPDAALDKEGDVGTPAHSFSKERNDENTPLIGGGR